MDNLPPALAALGNYKQFIVWKPVPKDNGKTDKLPVNPLTGENIDHLNPANWLDAQTAINYAKMSPDWGVGFVFTAGTGFFFHDLDGCLENNGQWSQVAQDICTKFAGCAVEVSHSGTGLHIFGRGKVPEHGCKNKTFNLELYTDKRFCALTGTGAIGDAGAEPAPGVLEWLVNNYFPPSGMKANPEDWTSQPVPEYNGPPDDNELIQKILSSRSAGAVFGNKASVQALWDADAGILSEVYPDSGPNNRPFDHNNADMALCSHLAFWTGKDCERMDRLFRKSRLYRDKWEKRQDYRQNTILKAVHGCKSVYSKPSAPAPAPMQPVETITKPLEPQKKAEAKEKTGLQYLTPDQQKEYFAGCVYIQTLHRIFIPNGMLLKPEQFKATFGGYIFALDSLNDKTTKNAWEVFTESQAIQFPKATNIVFRPDQPPGALLKEEGLIMLNSYVPIKVERKQGDVTPFLDLIARLFPDERDRGIILAYMAACVQYPGTKFQWAPLIQGCEGNGKSLLITAVSKAVGVRYTHLPPASDISNIFNAWISGKLFIGVEEVYVHDKREVMDALKTLITNKRVPVTPKGVDQITGDNRANFMATSNHKGAIRIAKKNNRRWCIFFTPQQSYDDIIRDGMGAEYFPRLYSWCDNGGWAIVNEFLFTYAIPDQLNPAMLCHRAPTTSSTDEAASATLGAVEQDILEAIGEGRAGFAGGWVSSMALGELLKNRRGITQNKKKEILAELGYILHPGLKDGRVNNIIPIDGGKPRLYIRADHEHAKLVQTADIVKYYVLAQTGAQTLT